MKKIHIYSLVLFHFLACACFAPLDLEGLAPPAPAKDEGANNSGGPEKPGVPEKKINVPAPEDGVSDSGRAVARNGFDDHVTFSNEDKLHGRLIGVNFKEGGLVWKHPSAKSNIVFSLEDVREIVLGKAEKQAKPSQTASIRLTNGDYMSGNIVSMDQEYLVLDTWYAGRVNVEKVMVTSIRPNAEGSTIIYEGPDELANWSTGDESMKNTWKLKNGALYPMQSHPIGREIDGLPDSASIEFECDWRGYPAFNFVFYTDNIDKVSGNYYMLQVSSSSVYMRRYTRNQGSQNMWNLNYSNFSNNRSSTARFNLLVNKDSKSFTLLVNGQLLKQWTDPGSFAGMGNGIMFAPQNAGGMKFYNIRISDWDGTIPQPSDVEEEEATDDQIQFVNKDKVSGRLNGIAGGKASFKTEFATLEVPLDRIGEVLFSAEEAERARRNKEDVRLAFTKHGVVTIQLHKIEENTVHGYSENFGDVSMPLNAFKGMTFNIYEKKDGDDEDFDF